MIRQAILRLKGGGGNLPNRSNAPSNTLTFTPPLGQQCCFLSFKSVGEAVSAKETDNDSNSVDDLYSEEEVPKDGEWAGCRRSFMAPLTINCSGTDTLYNPLFNKGTAFKSGERDRLRFRGLLPYRMTNIHLQKERFLEHLRAETSPIKKNLLLEDLHDRNETLYHRVLVDHMDEMAPLIYTPTVGQACMEFAARFRRPRGMYFTPHDRGNMAASTSNPTIYS